MTEYFNFDIHFNKRKNGNGTAIKLMPLPFCVMGEFHRCRVRPMEGAQALTW